MVIVAAVIVAAIAGPALAPHSATAQDLSTGIARPSATHWLGTDDLGRDVFSRTIVGARTAVLGPLLVALGAMLIGNLLGLLAGYTGGWLDTLVSRYADLVYALPALLVAIVVVGVVGGGYFVAVGLLVVLYSPVDTRLIRSATLVQRSQPYVEAARVTGVPARRIMLAHIWPNVLPLAVANAFLTFAFSIVSLAALSFLGLGVGPGTADWGRMLSDSRTLLFDNEWTTLGPGIALVLTAASVNVVGDWLFERLSERGRVR
ncbi:MAG: peptide/nickel transport system permease protein [Gaiellaceae bacterium]|nr:peptide/nickel transport system permease protein [Gaiellaceae bacterium]